MMLPSFLLKGLYEKGFFNPLPIQKMVLPEAIKKKANIIGTAQTVSHTFLLQIKINFIFIF